MAVDYGKREQISKYDRQQTRYAGTGHVKRTAGEALGYVGLKTVGGAYGIWEGAGDIVKGVATGSSEPFRDDRSGTLSRQLDETVNPGEALRFAGDVGSGVGQNLWYTLDYSGLPVGTVISAMGHVGNGISEGVGITGKLGWRELLYGTLTGSEDTILDKAMYGGARAISNGAPAAARALKSGASKVVSNGVAKEVLSSFGGEAAQEFIEDYTDTFWQKHLLKDETADYDIKRALRSAAVGGFSGGIIGGATSGISTAASVRTGKKIAKTGRTDELIDYARKASDVMKAGSERRAEDIKSGAAQTKDGKVGRVLERLSQTKENKRMRRFGETLRENLEAWDKLTDKQKQSNRGMALLGEIRDNIWMTESASASMLMRQQLESLSDENVQDVVDFINKQRGTKYTPADFKEDKDNIATNLAVNLVADEVIGVKDLETAVNEIFPGKAETKGQAAKVSAVRYAVSGNKVTHVKGSDKQAEIQRLVVSNGQTMADVKVGGEVKRVRLDDLEFATQDEADVYSEAERLKAGALLEEQMGKLYRTSGNGMSGSDFARAFLRAARYGELTGGDMSVKVSDAGVAALSETARRAAYRLGAAEAKERAAREQASVRKTQESGKRTERTYEPDRVKLPKGFVKSKMNEQQRAAYGAARVLASVLNTDIELLASHRNEAGELMYTIDGKEVPATFYGETMPDGRIIVDINAQKDGQNVTLYVLAHEATHTIRQKSPAQFEKLAELTVMRYQMADASFEDMVEERLQELEKRHGQEQAWKNMTESERYDYAREEVVCDSMQTVLNDGVALQEMANREPTVFGKLKQFITELIGRIRRAMKGIPGYTKEAREFAGIAGDMEEIERAFAEAAEEAGSAHEIEKTQSVNEIHHDLTILSERYDFSKSFSEQIEDYLHKKFKKTDTLVVCGTPDVFQRIGLLALPMTYTTSHLDDILNKKDIDHSFPIEEFKKLPQKLEEPIAIIASRSPTAKSTSVVAIVDITHNERKTIAAVLIDGFGIINGNRIDSNAITSVHTRQNAITSLLADAVQSEKNGKVAIFYWDKKRAMQQLNASGVQFPGGNNITDGYVHSISQKSEFVNSKEKNIFDTKQFKRWFRQSKAVNPDGTPMILYHQTEEDFTVFDERHEGAGTYDDETPFGVFLKPSNADIGLKGKKQMALYASIQNPLVANNRAELVRKLREISPEYTQLKAEIESNNITYGQLVEDAGKAWADYAREFRKSNPGAGRNALNEDARFQELFDEEDRLTDEWTEKNNGLSKKCKEVITSVLEQNGYDGVILREDAGSMGRKTETFIALKNTQVKSATDNIGIFDRENKDIRYSDRPFSDLTTRNVLAQAQLSEVTRKEQREFLQKYQETVAEARKAEKAVKAAQFRAAELNRDIRQLGGQINKLRKQRDADAGKTGARTRASYIEEIRELSEKRNNLIKEKNRALNEETKQTGIEVTLREALRAQEASPRAKQIIAAVADRAERERETASRVREAERAQSRTESARKTALRNRITSQIAKINQRLAQPTPASYIPKELQPMMVAMLDAINPDAVDYPSRIATARKNLEQEMAKDKPDNAVIEQWQRVISDMENQKNAYRLDLARLEKVYASIRNSADPSMYDDTVMEKIRELDETVRDTPVAEMSLEQLEAVETVIHIINHKAENAKKAYAIKRGAAISELGEKVVDEIKSGKQASDTEIKALRQAVSFGYNNLKPLYFMDMMKSDTLKELFWGVYRGESDWARLVDGAKKFRREACDEFGADKWDNKTEYEFKDADGNVFRLHLQEMMSLYAYSKREQAYEHLRQGGFVFGGDIVVTKKVKGIPVDYVYRTKKTVRLDEMSMAKISAALTEQQRAYADRMQSYLSTDMAAAGNKVSQALWGIDLFTEGYYFPLKTDSDYRAELNTQAKGESMIKNKGMTKSVTPKANNPIILNGFDSVWARHCNEMSVYASMVLPLEDFNRVFNSNTAASPEAAPTSVKSEISSRYGEQAVAYIKTLMTELNGGLRNEPDLGLSGKMLSLFKKGATFMSLSVIIQQPTSVCRAFSMVDPKYFRTLQKMTQKEIDSQWDIIRKYAPVAIIKDMGYFDTNNGRSTEDYINETRYDTFKEKADAMVHDGNFRDEVLSKGPALADQVTWCWIWKACENEAEAKGQERGTEAFYTAVGERFYQVIARTQVYDSVMTRSGMMRSKNTVDKMATAFMAEPTTSLNMIVDAVRHFGRKDKKKGAEILGSVIASILLNSLLVSLIYAARDNDEEATFGEKYASQIIDNAGDNLNPANMIPYVRDIVSLCEGYDVERTDMSVIADVISSVRSISSGSKSGWEKVQAVAGSVGNAFGLPVRNVMRDTNAIVNVIGGNKEEATDAGLRYAIMQAAFGKTVSNGQQMYDALMDGDEAHYRRVRGRFSSESAANTALRQAMRTNDGRIAEAAEALETGDKDRWASVCAEIVAEGRFSEEDVKAAVNAEYNAMKKVSA